MRLQIAVGYATPRFVVLDSKRWQGEQAMKIKPVSNILPWLLFHLLAPESCFESLL